MYVRVCVSEITVYALYALYSCLLHVYLYFAQGIVMCNVCLIDLDVKPGYTFHL